MLSAQRQINEEEDTLRDLPLDDSDNMHRSHFESRDMLRRKLRLWNEDSRDSTPVRCINKENPRTVEQSVAEKRKYRLLCVTFTYVKQNDKAALLNKAWGTRCHRHIVITNKDNGLSDKIAGGKKNVVELTPMGGEGYSNMWQKTRATLLYFKKQQEVRTRQNEEAAKTAEAGPTKPAKKRLSFKVRSEKDGLLDAQHKGGGEGEEAEPNMGPGDEIILTAYDYIFFAGDDVLLIPENLHRMVNEPPVEGMHQMGVPLHFGYRQITVADIPFISGAGYVLNSAALQLMTLIALNDKAACSPDLHASAEDVYLAMCLQKALGVVSRDTRDAFGEDRFNILNVDMLMWETRDIAFSWWWRDYRDRPVPRGLNVMSRDSILIHYIQTDDDLRKWTEAVYGTTI